MSNTTRVKICGLRQPDEVAASVAAGAAFVGFVSFPKSPRHVDLATAQALALDVPVGVAKVMLVVNPDDALLDEICETVAVDLLQLHGNETPERVSEIRRRTGLPVMKAVGVASADDLSALDLYGAVADMLLVDAKAPKDATRPGGNGLAFDWRLLAGRDWPVPWMLAGGLTEDNVADAVRITGARQVDVSTGVETAPGRKDLSKITGFSDRGAPVSVRFREASRNDVGQIVAMLADDVLGQGRESDDLARYLAAFDGIMAEGGNVLIVGEVENRVAATYQLTFISGLSLRAARRAQIESVRVHRDFRGQGLGRQMMLDAEQRAIAAGCTLLQLTSNKSRSDALRFYESAGFTASHIGFKRVLPDTKDI